MPDTLSLPQPHHSLTMRVGKESPGRQPSTNPSAGFPEYLKHMDMLDNNGHSVKFTASNSLFQAVLKGRVRSTEYLLDRGTSVNGRNDYGFSLLTAALHIDDRKRRDRMFSLLLERGADPQFKDGTYDRNVLHWACVLGRAEQVECLLNEVAVDLDLRQKDNGSYTALHHAVMAGHLPVVRLLVDIHRKFGVTVDVADRLGLTPYLHAKRLGYREVAAYLHSEGLASQGHGDMQFRTPREWSQIGRFERQRAVQVRAQEVINNAKIQGNIRHLRSLELTASSSPRLAAATNSMFPSHSPSRNPRVRLAVRHSDRLSTSLPSLQEDGRRPKGMRRPTSANGVPAAERDENGLTENGHSKDSLDGSAAAAAAAVPGPPREAFVHDQAAPTFPKDLAHRQHHLLSLAPQAPGHARGGGVRLQAPATGSPLRLLGAQAASHGGRGGLWEEAEGDLSFSVPGVKGPHSTAAFTLMEMNKKGKHASTYRQSQFDETKASEYQHILGNLNSIMDMLSQQQSKSFRKSVKYQRPETPKKPKQKQKVSSLAVIFGRNNKSGKRSRRRSAKATGSRKKDSASTKKKKGKDGGGGEEKTKAPVKKRAVPLLKVNDRAV